MQLKPCPFCGKINNSDDSDVCHPSGTVWIREVCGNVHYCHRNEVQLYRTKVHGFCYEINCPEHYGGCGANITGDSEKEVVELWNTRV
jgi:hypothetical protein